MKNNKTLWTIILVIALILFIGWIMGWFKKSTTASTSGRMSGDACERIGKKTGEDCEVIEGLKGKWTITTRNTCACGAEPAAK